MILKGNSRGGSKDLALHLMKPENDHVEIHDLRGFASRDLLGALNEAYAISRGTRCQAYLYSLSINPPPKEKVATSQLIDAADKVEKSLGLDGQPRAVVFHEKEGRRHAHVVWSRIRTEDMKAIRMSYDRTRLQTVSRELFREHGWRMPDGLADRTKRDPRNFTLADWQQAKRNGQDAKAIKAAIQDAWSISDSKASLRHALEERGYFLARGDRRDFVVVDLFGEVRSLPRMAGVKTKDVRALLGEGKDLPDVTDAKTQAAQTVHEALGRIKRSTRDSQGERAKEYARRKADLIRRQRAARDAHKSRQERRWKVESLARQAKFRTGLKGLWDTLRGHNRSVRLTNECEAEACRVRDHIERDGLIQSQLSERRRIDLFKLELRQEFQRERADIERDVERYGARSTASPTPEI